MERRNQIQKRSDILLPIAVLYALLAVGVASATSSVDLERGFLDPPASARPHTWWHWMNGNITKEGLTADLEAMKRIGLGGAQIFNVSESIPDGPVRFMSSQWRDLLKHAVQEANRLGLELCIHNCAGWSSSGGPWVTPEFAMQQVVISETRATGPARFSAVLKQPDTQRSFYRDIAVLAFPTPRDDSQRIVNIRPKAGFEARYGQQPDLTGFSQDSVIPRKAILDLTERLDKDGRLTWDVPEGDWIILRLGYTPTGAQNAPAPASGRGLECDKLSREALDVHWAGMMAQVIGDLGPLAGKTLNNALIDSYEVGHQNWTPRFCEEFQRRRGYDPLRLLPVLTGRVVDGGETSELFLWDFRRTIADLFADNYYTYFSELCHKNGLQASIEPYDGPFECLLAGRDADIPMGEFWVGGGESSSCKLAASVAHTYGRRLVGAESFTATPDRGRWQNYPYSLKAVGDLMYCTGINRYIVHRYAHQPWLDRFPGMTMGQWGTHFERTTTWWNQGEAWVRYLTRCQFLLQQGLFAADVCFFAGEAVPNNAPYVPALKAKGYDYDACNADVLFRRMTVKNGRLALPDGMSYRVLVLPETAFMTPRLLAKIRDLVEQGAVVIGPKPTQSPSLSDYPESDATVKKVSNEVWGQCDGKTVKEHTLGKGRVIWGRPVEEVLTGLGVKPDCEFTDAVMRPKMAWIHRVAEGADVFFVANQRPMSQEVRCTFRVGGRLPELWHPDTGQIEAAPVWSEQDGRTTVSIQFDPAGSVFVVFRRSVTGQDHLAVVKWPVSESAKTAEPSIVIRQASYEAVDGTGGADVTAKVAALVKAGESGISASNDIFGDPTVNHVKRLRVDYTVGGKPFTKTADEGAMLTLSEGGGPLVWPTGQVTISSQGRPELLAFRPGVYEFLTAQGKTMKNEVRSVPEPIEVAGPWTLRFPANWGAPPQVTLDKLISWTEHKDPGVRYFSGTAEYQKEFEIPGELLKQGQAMILDLGQVKHLAEVTFNGQGLGVWWKPPFAADVTRLARPGRNLLRIRVTNLWVNRLIGDEQVPDDCEWNGKPLKRWPQWFLDGKPRPVPERLTFTTWKHWTKDGSLIESGLLGPVVIRPAAVVDLD